MKNLKLFPALLAVASLTVGAASADAQGRQGGFRGGGTGSGDRGGGGGGGGDRGGDRGGNRDANRGGDRGARQGQRVEDRRGSGPVVVVPRGGYVAPYRGYRGYRPGLSLGFYTGYPYFYGRYGYPYGYYPGYDSGYGSGYVTAGPGASYGGLRIQGAPEDAQVYADGYYLGIVDDFDGALQQADLTAGPHRIEIRAPGYPPAEFDVRIEPGQTVTYHADRR